MKPIRILHVLGTLNRGGAESRIMDLYRNIDRDRVQFDFLVHYQLTEEDQKAGDLSTEKLIRVRPAQAYDEEVTSLGGRIYVLPRFTGRNLLQYKKAARDFFQAHHDFAAVEGHMTSMASIYLPQAKQAGVPITIAHARSAGVDAGIRGIVTRCFRAFLPGRCDVMMTCSRAAGISVYGQKNWDAGKVLLIPNAIDVSEYQFDPSGRDRIRKELGIAADEIVIGHVGRFDFMKNQSFLAGVLEGLKETLPDQKFRMVFVGEGKLRQEVESKFAAKGLGEQTVFAGLCDRPRTIAMYQAFDLFFFPSLFEGLPGTVIEAQASGLPCLIADTIAQEVAATDLVQQLPVNREDPWILEGQKLVTPDLLDPDGRRDRSLAACKGLGEAGYDARALGVKMTDYYLGLVQK